MNRPLLFLVVVIAVASAALLLLLPLSKIAHHGSGIEAVQPLTPTPGSQSSGVAAPAAVQAPAVTPKAVAADPTGETAVTLSGRVGNAAGAPIGGLEIVLERQDFGAAQAPDIRVHSDRYGNFTLALQPGPRYRLTIAAAGDYAGYSLEDVSVASASRLQDIVLQRVERVDVDGMIVDTGFAPVADFEMSVRHQSLQFPDRVIRSDSSGFFSLRGFPAGTWRITTRQSDYYDIRGLELLPGEYRNLTLVIDRGAYHLSGWVRDGNGLPLADARVTLKSAFAQDEYQSFAYRSVSTDTNGGFAIDGLGGQPLTVGIYARGFKTYIRQHRFQSFSDTLEIVLQK